MKRFHVPVRALGALLSLLFAWPATAGAQTTFAWPARDVDYARYTLPEQCEALGNRLEASGWRGAALAVRDTTPYNPRDTLPAAVATAARACVAKFRAEMVAPFELPWLFHLDLVAGRDDDAKRVVTRQFALARTTAERGAVLVTAVTELLAARPARLTAALEYAARIDSLGAWAETARQDVHRTLARYALAVLDTAMLAQQLDAYWPTPFTADDYLAMQLRMLRQQSPDEKTAIQDVLSARSKVPGISGSTQRLAVQHIAEQFEAVAARGRPRVAGSFWFSNTSGDTIRPADGKVSLLVFVGVDCADSRECASNYAVLRRLGRRLGGALDVTLMARTEGYFRGYPPPTPAHEAELLRGAFLDDLRLPGALSVITTPFTRLPDPDRRRVNGPTPNLQYFGWVESDGGDNIGAEPTLSAFLIGRDGLVKAQVACTPKSERFLAALVTKAIGPQPSTSARPEPRSNKDGAGS